MSRREAIRGSSTTRRGNSTPRRLRAALEALPPEQREVIVAHLWGGLTFEQVGVLAGCSTSMAYRRYTAGVETLRARWEESHVP